jgi:hypothetical protein
MPEISLTTAVQLRLTDLDGAVNVRFPTKLPRRSVRPIASLGGLLLLAAFHAAADPSQSAPNPPDADNRTSQEAPSPGNTSAQHDRTLPEITIQARRDQIKAKVRSFVNGSLYLENEEAPARWNSPVCPTVIGLSRDDGEFILARLSQIARAAGVPLGGERCAPPNLYVVATANPVELLKKWGNSEHWRMFGDAGAGAINAFIDTPRAVRVWYNSGEVCAAGMGSSMDAPSTGVSLGPGTGTSAPFFTNCGAASHITRNVIWSLTSVIVVVDKTRLRGVTRGQLADYVGMYAFSRLKAGALRSDAPTILGLFDGVSAQSPGGLTTWDEAFLESLYHIDARLILQRALMVQRMVSHIVPESPAQPQAR